jgi:hypothetical protein
MRLRCDEDLVEAAVLLGATGAHEGIPALQIARFHREREKLYNVRDPDDRNRAFFSLHLEWFREWGFEKRLTAPLQEFPLLSAGLKILAFRKSRGGNDEGAELYINESDERSGLVGLHPKHLVQNASLLLFLRRELMHLNDMVDPVFGYQPELALRSPFPGAQRVARDRYRQLWDTSIDGRLHRSGRAALQTKAERWSEFADAFAFWTEARRRAVFESLWADPAPTHQGLAELARHARDLEAAAGPGPGIPCPLCAFPTFAWADETRLTRDAIKAIQSEFPRWEPTQGACARCSRIYQLKAARSLPAQTNSSFRLTQITF